MGGMESLAGSWVAIPLLATSLVAMTLIFERLWFWRRISQRQRQLARMVLETYAQKPQTALTHLKKNTDLPLARIFLAALTLPEATPEEFRIALESAAQGELPLLQRVLFHTAELGCCCGAVYSYCCWSVFSWPWWMPPLAVKRVSTTPRVKI